MKRTHEEKKVEVLVDRELGNNYDRIEVGEMVQVALLCTRYLPVHRPKMSEVVRMLEGDGLAEKWAASHKHNNLNSNPVYSQSRHINTVGDHDHDYSSSIFDMMMDQDHDAHAIELSGPR